MEIGDGVKVVSCLPGYVSFVGLTGVVVDILPSGDIVVEVKYYNRHTFSRSEVAPYDFK